MRTLPFALFSALSALPACKPSRAAQPPPAPSASASLTVTAPSHVGLLAVHDLAPAFRALTQDGRTVQVDAAPRARPLIVYFYPRDETPGCIIEAEGFRDSNPALTQAGVDVIGVSTDSLDSHAAFAAHRTLPFGLVSDPHGQLAAAFGVELHNGHAQRVTFLIDRTSRIAQVFPNVNPTGHADEVLTAARAL